MTAPPLLLLSGSELDELMTIQDHLDAVELGFRALADGGADLPPPMHVHAVGGAFHAKGAALLGDRAYAAVKINGNFPGNPAVHGLPTVQGLLLLFDAETGTPLALMDSIAVTLARTAAATAVAARHLARADSSVVAIIGCGAQASHQLRYLAHLFPVREVRVHDRDPGRAAALAGGIEGSLGLAATACSTPRAASLGSDVIVTCTTATSVVLDVDDVSRGAFIAAVGADNPSKCEIAPDLMAAATVYADLLDQCVVMGDLHHALAAGTMERGDVAGELADLVSGRVPGRRDADRIIVFDSTGVGIQDAAAAIAAYERALATGAGRSIHL